MPHTTKRQELALKVTHRWIKILGRPLLEKGISISFEVYGYFPEEGTVTPGGLPYWAVSPPGAYQAMEIWPKAVAHLLKDGRIIPESEVREAALKNSFDSIQITVFQVPEKERIPKWVEEEYFVRGILRALLRIRYPDWNERQLVDYEEKLMGMKRLTGLRSVSLPKAAFYACALVLAVFFVTAGIWWVLDESNPFGFLPSLTATIMLEGIGMVLQGLLLTEVYDLQVFSPSGLTFLEHVRFPPRLTAAVAFAASGLSLFFTGVFLLSTI